MIHEKQTQAKVLQDGESQESIGMSLDLESAQVLMQMLSKNLYSDAIGSTVRECASNALDSHRRAGVTDPIIVTLKINNDNNYEFSVEDFGTGLNADDVTNIISKYGKSTKRDSNVELGMMGLGFKAPLAYTSSFYFVCRKDGKERKYMMYEGEEVNTIDLLYEADTAERNGVKVIVPVNYDDRSSFFIKIKNQLAYFESVFFDVNVNGNCIDNEFQIVRTEHFQTSGINTDGKMHICLDNVYYPIDYAKLGISEIKVPIGLRFGLSDGLFPTPNREQLIYSTKAIKTIKDKIVQVAEVLVNKYNEYSIDCKDVHEIFRYYSNSSRFVTFGITIDASLFSHYTSIDFKKPVITKYPLTDFKLLYDHKNYLLYEYTCKMTYSRGRFTHTVHSWNTNVDYSDMKDPSKVFIFDESFVGNKKLYIKSLLPANDYQTFKIIRKTTRFTLKGHSRTTLYDNYYNLLGLNKYPKKDWRVRIIEFQKVLEELISKVQVIDNIDIPQSWLDARKKVRAQNTSVNPRRAKLQGEINCKLTEELQRYVHGKSSKLTPDVIKMESLHRRKFLHVYGRQKDESLIDNLFAVSKLQKVKYIVLSEREYKVVENLDVHNLMSIEKFMRGKAKPFKRIVTSYLIKELMKKYECTFLKKEILNDISSPLYEKIEKLSKYKTDNYVLYCDNDIYQAMVEVSEQHKLFDETIYTEYLQIKKLLDNYPFIETTMRMMPYGNSNPEYMENVTVLADLFKYHKQRINYTNYKLVLNEDKPLEETMTDEKIDQLEDNV